MVHCGNSVAFGETNWKPESMPCPGAVWMEHGLAKVDWVTLWFFDWNWKDTVSPCAAVMLGGEKASSPPAPTVTRWSAADARRGRVAAATREKRISDRGLLKESW